MYRNQGSYCGCTYCLSAHICLSIYQFCSKRVDFFAKSRSLEYKLIEASSLKLIHRHQSKRKENCGGNARNMRRRGGGGSEWNVKSLELNWCSFILMTIIFHILQILNVSKGYYSHLLGGHNLTRPMYFMDNNGSNPWLCFEPAIKPEKWH